VGGFLGIAVASPVGGYLGLSATFALIGFSALGVAGGYIVSILIDVFTADSGATVGSSAQKAPPRQRR
jgi:hypothetical protein